MIVGPKFEGDNDERVMWLQHDRYGLMLGKLFEAARRKYSFAESVIGTRTEAGKLVEPLDGFDHRVLQNCHDLIAASFRYRHRNDLQPQLPLPGQEEDDGRVLELWTSYFQEEVERLSQLPHFTRGVVDAVAYANTPAGSRAEEKIRDVLIDEYGFGMK